MMPVFIALFETAIGRCGIAWSACGVAGLQLPEDSEQETRERLLVRFPIAQEAQPAGAAMPARDGIVAHLCGEPWDLSTVPLDMGSVPPFHRRVYVAARKIPWGTTTTYGALAAEIGEAGAARAVGQALARNPFAIIVPCHRVVAAGRRIGGFSANGGIATKLRLLAIEGMQGHVAAGLFPGLDLAVKTLRCG
jgi:methylated-DNA-[protein]-cysteine S-methyltransferase